MACHSDSFGRGEEIEQIRSGAIAYISSRGEEDGKRLQEALTAVDPSIIQLKFLAAKGQIFKFPEYSKCYNALTLLIWHYGRIQAFLSIIQAPSWNWDNIHVTSLLEKIITINPDQVLEDFARQDTQIIEFCRGSYQKIYG